MPATPRAKLVFWSVIGVFAIVVAGTSVFSWWVVGGVRAQAEATDGRLRELAWAVLAYADRNDGFPTSEAELRAFAAAQGELPETLAHKPLAGTGRAYPMSRTEAQVPAANGPIGKTLDQALSTIEVEWPIVRDVQPILRPRGLPTMQGTGEAVGQWLYAMAERLRAQ